LHPTGDHRHVGYQQQAWGIKSTSSADDASSSTYASTARVSVATRHAS
jgi:hypothetical protein